MTPPPGLVVLGPARSGTSLVCRVLATLGVDFGPTAALLPADRFNPGGYVERRDVVDANNRLLESAGRTFEHPGPPETLVREADLGMLDHADLGWTVESPRWGIKDPRFCATLHAWIAAGRLEAGALRLVRVRRDPSRVALSGGRYPAVARHFGGDPARLELGARRYDALAAWQIEASGRPVHEVQYEALIAEPRAAVAALAAFAGLAAPAAVARAARRVGRRRNRLRGLARRIPRRAS